MENGNKMKKNDPTESIRGKSALGFGVHWKDDLLGAHAAKYKNLRKKCCLNNGECHENIIKLKNICLVVPY